MATELGTETTLLLGPENEDKINGDIMRKLSAAARVFDVTELVELILLQLPCLDLLRASSVCRSFQATVAASGKIQTALFLESLGPVMDGARLLLCIGDPEAVLRAGVILSQRTNGLVARQSRAQRILDVMNGIADGSSTPDVFIAAGALFSTYTDADGGVALQTCVDELKKFPLGSFARMFVTQPPMSQIVLGSVPSVIEEKKELTELDIGQVTWTTQKEGRTVHRIRFPEEGRITLSNPAGITVGQLVDHFVNEPKGDTLRYFQFFGQLSKVQPRQEETIAEPKEEEYSESVTSTDGSDA